MKHIETAIATCGTQAKLAAACGVTQAAVSKWLNGAKVKAEHAIAIETATNSKVTRHDIRPDIFGEPNEAA